MSFRCFLLSLAASASLSGGVGALQGSEQSGAAAPAISTGLLAPPSQGGYLSNLYSIDDGSTESSLGLLLGGTLCWFQRFDTLPTAPFDVITEVQVAYGFPGNPGLAVPNGTPATACVWEDPNDDGDPSDAVLVSLKLSTVANVDTQALNPIAMPHATVRGKFFAGVFVKHPINRFPASRDTSTLSLGRAFFVGTTTANGTFDPANLDSVNHTEIFSMD